MRKECCFALLIFLVISAIPSVIYSRTTNSAYAQTVSLPPSSSQEVAPFKKLYDEQKGPSNTVGVKITSPVKGQKVPVGELVVSGTSTDNAITDCQVYVDVNDIKPMQNTTAAGVGGQNDYSNWTFTYTSKYHLILEGINELTAKLSCINSPANIKKYYSVNVTGVATPLVAINNTTTIAPTSTSTSNATTKNETQQTTTTTMTTMENNETQVSPDTANQTQQQQTPQMKPKPALQPEPSTSSVVQQPLNQTQSQEEEPAVVGEEEEEPTMTNATQGPTSIPEPTPEPTPTHEPKEPAVVGEEEEEPTMTNATQGPTSIPEPTPEPTPTHEPKEPAVVGEEEEEQLIPKPANEDSQAAVEICDNTLDDDDDGLVDTEDTEDCPVAETPEEPAVAEEQKEQEQKEQEQKEQEKKQPITDSQKEGSFTSEEFVPLDESSTGSDIISEEPKETKGTADEKKLTELTEPATSDDAYDKEQIEQEEPLEDELRPLERQEVPLEMIERQPLEQNQSLEILEDQQPIEEQPVQTFNKEEEQPLQPGIQPLEQQPLEEQQPLQTFDRQQLSPIQQQQPLEQQPLEQQLIIEQQVPESPAGKQQQEEKRSINQVQEHHSNGDNMPFILPFDSQDVISAN